MFNDLITYSCSDCKSSFSTLKDKNIDHCIYCNGTNINFIKNNDYENTMIIPFTLNIEDIKKQYRKRVFWNPLIPFSFKRKKNINKIEKVYYPSYLVDMNIKGITNFLAADKNKIFRNNKRLTELKKYNVKYDVNFDYSNVLINSFDKISDKEFSKISQYNFDSLKSIDEKSIKNVIIINQNISEKDVEDLAKERLMNKSLSIVRKNINHELKKLEDNNTELQIESFKSVLVPIYFLTLTYRKKIYRYMVNGTNNNYYYKFPIGIVETIIFSIILFAILFGIIYYIATIL